ncbi:Molybdopterin-synthase adenylyltransferase [compost metagenome]
MELVNGVDLILDACDNFHTRFIINDVAQKYQTPWIYGACVGSYGISYTILPGETPCLSCMMDLIPGNGESCDINGIIAPSVQLVVANQAAEALKILTGNMEALHRKLISFDLWSNQFARMNIQSMKNEQCPSCALEATYPYLQSSMEENERAAALCGRDTVHIRPNVAMTISIEELRASLDKQEGIQMETTNSFLLSANVNDLRIVMFNDGRALVHGTADIVQARQVYKRVLGYMENKAWSQI